MKQSIIRQIFDSNIGLQDYINPTAEYKRLADEAILCEKEVLQKLPQELIALFEKNNETNYQLHSESLATHFSEGFKLGLLIGMEVFEKIK